MSLTHDAFVAKYSGKPIDFDKKFGFQCVDLMRQYCVEVLGIPGYTLPAAQYAKQIYTRYSTGRYFKKVKNTPNGIPPKGSLVFWGPYLGVTGFAGHVAIVHSAGLYKFVSFDQNYPTGTLSHLQSHDYRGVMGWLEPIKK